MKKAGLVLVLLVIFTGYEFSEAGQWCWQITPTDFVKLCYVRNDANYPFGTLSGMWYRPGIAVVPLDGTMVKSADGTRRMMTLIGTFPGAIQTYVINAEIDATTKNGTFYIYYVDVNSSDSFPMTKVKCDTLPTP